VLANYKVLGVQVQLAVLLFPATFAQMAFGLVEKTLVGFVRAEKQPVQYPQPATAPSTIANKRDRSNGVKRTKASAGARREVVPGDGPGIVLLAGAVC